MCVYLLALVHKRILLSTKYATAKHQVCTTSLLNVYRFCHITLPKPPIKCLMIISSVVV